MALTPKAPNGIAIPAATGDLYTAGAFTAVFPPRSIIVVNKGSVARTFNLFTRVDGANDFRITSKDQSIDVGGIWYNSGPFALETGDKLRGDATGAGADVDLTFGIVLEKT